MIYRTISLCQGKGSIGHNNRVFHTKNTSPALTPNNIVFVQQPIKEAYEQLFGEAVERYNARQTRSDRKIKNGYFEYQFGQPVTETRLTSPDKRKSFYEDVVQLGTMDDTGVGTVDGELAVECLCEYMNGFSERNPNFYVFNAVLHLDEKTPHLHIDYIPVGHYKRGVDTQNGIAQALKEMGYGSGKDAVAKWRQAEYLVFRKICEEHGFHIAEPKKSRGSLTVEEYKNYCADKKRLNEKLKPLREMELAADESSIVGKKQLLSHNITVTPEELQQLETQKKAVAVQQIDNHNKLKGIADREKALDEREAEIADKEAESIQLSIERSANLDRRESEIETSNRQSVFLMNKAENQMRLATARYNEQVELNHRYSELNDKFRKLDREYAECSHTLSEIRQAVGIAYSDDETDTLDRCHEIVDENYQIKDCIAKELHLSYKQKTSIKLPDMLKMLIDNFKDKLKTAEIENEENKSVITSLREQLSSIKQEFIKVVLGINTLVYDKKYSSGLSGFSKALAKGISLFIDKCFEQREEFDLIDKCEIDSEIKENMQLFVEQTKERNYYER